MAAPHSWRGSLQALLCSMLQVLIGDHLLILDKLEAAEVGFIPLRDSKLLLLDRAFLSFVLLMSGLVHLAPAARSVPDLEKREAPQI